MCVCSDHVGVCEAGHSGQQVSGERVEGAAGQEHQRGVLQQHSGGSGCGSSAVLPSDTHRRTQTDQVLTHSLTHSLSLSLSLSHVVHVGRLWVRVVLGGSEAVKVSLFFLLLFLFCFCFLFNLSFSFFCSFVWFGIS